MDVFTTRDQACFVWDSDKARSNLAKHGISFERGVDAVSDPFALFEDASVASERREAAIGQDVLRRLLYAVHLVREDGCYRIVSVRLATRRERRHYEEFA